MNGRIKRLNEGHHRGSGIDGDRLPIRHVQPVAGLEMIQDAGNLRVVRIGQDDREWVLRKNLPWRLWIESRWLGSHRPRQGRQGRDRGRRVRPRHHRRRRGGRRARHRIKIPDPRILPSLTKHDRPPLRLGRRRHPRLIQRKPTNRSSRLRPDDVKTFRRRIIAGSLPPPFPKPSLRSPPVRHHRQSPVNHRPLGKHDLPIMPAFRGRNSL